MASTYVNDLRLNEMATGDGSGTWGTTTNTNLELIAEAFSYGTEAITTNADTHTTTIADGATDPGRALYLKYTGTLDSACTITIGPNTVSKVWIVENGTSGSQNIILSQGSGANITIPAGDTKVVYSDGVGAGAAFFDAFASLSVVDLKVQDDLTVTDDASIGGDATITGTLGVTGNITGTLATAAQPNITSVGTLTGFTSTGIDDNADATAITIDSSENVGIGVSSPSGVGGRIVEISSANTISELHITNSTSGSGAATGLTHLLNGVDAYAYNRENGAYIFGSNNTERLRIDSAGTLFQGTTSPTLHSSTTGIVFENGSLLTDVTRGAGKSMTLAQNAATDSGNTWAYLATDEASYYQQFGGNHYFSTAASGSAGADVTFDTKLFISNSGNVGIGTGSPTEKLSVVGGHVSVGDTTGVGGTEFLLEGYREVSGGTKYGNTSIRTTYDISSNASDMLFYTAVSGTNTDERMRIDSSGYVRVNNTSGLDGQFSSLTGAFYAGAFANTSAAYAPIYSWNRATSGNNLFCEFFTGSLGSLRGTIDYNRGAGLVRYNTSSDATLKNIIGDSDGVKSVEILNSTRIREFAWKDDETQKPQIGVIAQELYETYKGAVSVGGDLEKTDDEGNVTTEYQPWAVDKTAFTFHLVAGWQVHEKIIQEQQALIESLEARITALES
jgi:hypothetical protein